MSSAGGVVTKLRPSVAVGMVDVGLIDDKVAEDTETLILKLIGPRGASLSAPTATGTIADDDRFAVTVAPSALIVPEGGAARYTVVFAAPPTGPVSVTPAAASPELTR